MICLETILYLKSLFKLFLESKIRTDKATAIRRIAVRETFSLPIEPPIHHVTIVFEGFKGVPNWTPIVTVNVDFFQPGLTSPVV